MEFENNNIEMNEDMTTDLVDVEDFEAKTTEEESGLSTLAAMAIGAGLTAATFGVVKLVKKGIGKLKAKKEKKAVDAEVINDDACEDNRGNLYEDVDGE